MTLIGQVNNWKKLSLLIKSYHADEIKQIIVFFYKKKSISPNYLANFFINQLGLEFISIDCAMYRSISIFKSKIGAITYKSIVFLKNYEKLRPNIRSYFENFINTKHRNKNIQKIIDNLSIIITLNKPVASELKRVDLEMEGYSYDEIVSITNKIIINSGYDQTKINAYAIINVNKEYMRTPRYIEKTISMYERYEKIVELTKLEVLNFHNFFKQQFLLWNKLTILDLYYLLLLHSAPNNDNYQQYKAINNLYKNSKLKNYILLYLALESLIIKMKNDVTLTLKGEKLVANALKNKLLLERIQRLNFQLAETTFLKKVS